MGLKVAIRNEGELFIHMTSTTGNYATACGLDGADNHDSVQQEDATVPRGAKINCENCKAIWQLTKQYRASEFE